MTTRANSIQSKIASIRNWWWTLVNHRRIIAQLEMLLEENLEFRMQRLSGKTEFNSVVQSTLMKMIAVLSVNLIKANTGKDNLTCDLVYQGQRYEVNVLKAWSTTPIQRIEELSSILPELKRYLEVVKTELIVFEGGPSATRALSFLNLVEKWCHQKATELNIDLPETQ